jgi:uncharacterized membrane protein (DUF485 family)
MQLDSVKRIEQNPKFQELVKRRSSFVFLLSGLMTAIYFGFILTVAFAGPWLGTRIGDSVISIGIPLGLLVIFLAFLLTGIYVRRANSEFDRLTKEIIEETR